MYVEETSSLESSIYAYTDFIRLDDGLVYIELISRGEKSIITL